MKRTISFLVTIGLFIGFYSNVDAKSEQKQNDMIDIKEMIDENNISITSWMVYHRSMMDQTFDQVGMEKQVQKFMKDSNEYEWKLIVKSPNHHYVWEGTKNSTSNQPTERLKVKAYLIEGLYKVGITHELNGSTLDQEHLDLIENVFGNNQDVFYTVRGTMTSKGRKLQNVAEEMVLSVDGEIVESLYESSFVSVSAESNLFDTNLLTKDNEKLNLQIGLRKSETTANNIDVTIGTPIITVEY